MMIPGVADQHPTQPRGGAMAQRPLPAVAGDHLAHYHGRGDFGALAIRASK